MKSLFEFGYVARAHGLQGEVGVRTFDPTSDIFHEIERLVVRPREGKGVERELTIEDVRDGTKGDLLVTFEEVGTREGAEALIGSTLFAFREDLDEPEEGEFFEGDLIGLAAVSPEGEALGTVEELFNGGPVPNLVIRGGKRGELMIPFAEDFVVEVSLEKKTVVVKPLELEP